MLMTHIYIHKMLMTYIYIIFHGVMKKNALWGTCFTLTSFAPHLFLLGWLKLNLALLLDQLRLA